MTQNTIAKNQKVVELYLDDQHNEVTPEKATQYIRNEYDDAGNLIDSKIYFRHKSSSVL